MATACPVSSFKTNIEQIKLFKVPETKIVLWDHRPKGSPVSLHFTTHQRPRVFIKEKILQHASRLLESQKDGVAYCKFFGSVAACGGPSSRGIAVTLHQYDDTDHGFKSSSFGDVSVPVVISRKTKGKLFWDVDHYLPDLKSIYQNCSSLPCIDLSKLVKLKIYISMLGIKCDVDVEMFGISTVFKATPIHAIPTVYSELNEFLSRSTDSSPLTGFLTMDCKKYIILIPETDIKASELPLVGIWVSGVCAVNHPFVWAACVRYISSILYDQRLCLPPQPFLIALYNPLDYNPEFYNCISELGSSWLTFDMHYASASTTIPKVPMVDSKVFCVELSKQDEKPIGFEEARKRVEQHKISSCKSQIITNTDDMPQLSHRPQDLKTINLEHQVPDLSVLSELEYEQILSRSNVQRHNKLPDSAALFPAMITPCVSSDLFSNTADPSFAHNSNEFHNDWAENSEPTYETYAAECPPFTNNAGFIFNNKHMKSSSNTTQSANRRQNSYQTIPSNAIINDANTHFNDARNSPVPIFENTTSNRLEYIASETQQHVNNRTNSSSMNQSQSKVLDRFSQNGGNQPYVPALENRYDTKSMEINYHQTELCAIGLTSNLKQKEGGEMLGNVCSAEYSSTEEEMPRVPPPLHKVPKMPVQPVASSCAQETIPTVILEADTFNSTGQHENSTHNPNRQDENNAAKSLCLKRPSVPILNSVTQSGVMSKSSKSLTKSGGEKCTNKYGNKKVCVQSKAVDRKCNDYKQISNPPLKVPRVSKKKSKNDDNPTSKELCDPDATNLAQTTVPDDIYEHLKKQGEILLEISRFLQQQSLSSNCTDSSASAHEKSENSLLEKDTARLHTESMQDAKSITKGESANATDSDLLKDKSNNKVISDASAGNKVCSEGIEANSAILDPKLVWQSIKEQNEKLHVLQSQLNTFLTKQNGTDSYSDKSPELQTKTLHSSSPLPENSLPHCNPSIQSKLTDTTPLVIQSSKSSTPYCLEHNNLLQLSVSAVDKGLEPSVATIQNGTTELNQTNKQMCTIATMTSFVFPGHDNAAHGCEGQFPSNKTLKCNLSKDNCVLKNVRVDGPKITSKTNPLKNDQTRANSRHRNHAEKNEHIMCHDKILSSEKSITHEDINFSLSLQNLQVNTDSYRSPENTIHPDLRDYSFSPNSNQDSESCESETEDFEPFETGAEGEQSLDNHLNAVEVHKKVSDQSFFGKIVPRINRLLEKQDENIPNCRLSLPTQHSEVVCLPSDRRYSESGRCEKSHAVHNPSNKKKCKNWKPRRKKRNESIPLETVISVQHSCLLTTQQYRGHDFRDSDFSIQLSALNAKYRSNELNQFYNSGMSKEIFRTRKEVRQRYKQPSDLSLYGISSSDMSLATKQYLDRYGLVKGAKPCNPVLEDDDDDDSDELIIDNQHFKTKPQHKQPVWLFDDEH